MHRAQAEPVPTKLVGGIGGEHATEQKRQDRIQKRQDRITELESPTIDQRLRSVLLNARAGEARNFQNDQRRDHDRSEDPDIGGNEMQYPRCPQLYISH